MAFSLTATRSGRENSHSPEGPGDIVVGQSCPRLPLFIRPLSSRLHAAHMSFSAVAPLDGPGAMPSTSGGEQKFILEYMARLYDIQMTMLIKKTPGSDS